MATTTSAPAVELTGPLAALKDKFGDAVQPATFEGARVDPAHLLEAAKHIRDVLGYDYVSNACAVDYIKDGQIELVYHAYSTKGGGPLVFKARTPRDNAVLPSLVSVWPVVDFQEREAYDLFGVKFEGHPNL